MRSKRMAALIVAAIGAVVTSIAVGASVAAPARDTTARLSVFQAAPSCAGLTALTLENTVINSAAVVAASGTTPETCRVHATVSHPGANDAVGIDVWMPTEGWNGRFQGVGGGGYVGGSPLSLGRPVSEGFAAASSDLGHSGGSGSFALDQNGNLNWPLIRDFAYVGLHDLAVTGKAVVAAFYDHPADHAYWNGCSTGGRQGLSEAQRYPTDYDGILAAAPAINWARFIPAEIWPQLVMLRDGDVLPQCKFQAFQAAAIAACDNVGDGLADGVIGDPFACTFDPRSLIGTSTPCGTITSEDAAIVAKIMAGPRSTTGKFLWWGLTPGTSFAGLANTVTVGGTTVGAPFPIAVIHLGTWVQQNPSWDWTTLTYERFDQLFVQSQELFGEVIGTENADLSAFKDAGGKLVIWHGLVDQLIFPQGTIDYYERVKAMMGGEGKTKDFARLFLAPGVAHCAGGPGPQPENPLQAVIDWVEHNKAPKELNGVVRDSSGAVAQSRPICLYPLVATYKGNGDPADASSFVCRATKKTK